MSETQILVTQQFFDDAVKEYTLKKEQIVRTFILGCIEMGQMLEKYREIMIPEGKWIAFCEAIGTNLSQANQQIRIYEYSVKRAEQDILGLIITNRAKLNLFLSLPDEQKEELLHSGLTSESTTEDFRGKVVEIKHIGDEEVSLPEEVTDISIEDDLWRKMEKVSSIKNPLFEDTKIASKMLQDQLGFSINSRELVEGLIFIEKTKEVLHLEATIQKEEKDKLRMLFAKQLADLQDALDKFFS